jgi:maleamate amidohydrolase
MFRFILLFTLLISHAFSQNTAVIIVDMQYGFYTRGGVLQTDGLIKLVKKQQELLTWAKTKKMPILFFEYDGYQETDYALTSTLWGYKFKTVAKNEDNGFEGQSGYEANQYLRDRKVDKLIIAGINASGCVKRTAIGALEEGYQLISSGDLVADMYNSPPIYPQLDWFIEDKNFKGYKTLDQLLVDLEL